MVVLHASDIHCNSFLMKKILDIKYDVLCISGDLLEEPCIVPIDTQIKSFKKFFKELKKPILVCGGNHDLDAKWIKDIKRVHCNDIKDFKKLKFGCVPFGCEDFSKFKKCDVLVTHVPPFGSLCAYDVLTSKDLGDKYLTNALGDGIIKPKFILCGHIHHPKERYEKFLGVEVLNSSLQAYDINL